MNDYLIPTFKSGPESESKNGRKILLSTLGSRGDVQPMLALAFELVSLGYHPVFCVGPNFKDFVESYGFDYVAYSYDLTNPDRYESDNPNEAEWNEWSRHWCKGYIRDAIQTIYDVAQDCAMIVCCGASQHVGRSIADFYGIPYACAAYCPTVIPSPNHPPPHFTPGFNSQVRPKSVNKSLWRSFEKRESEFYLEALNPERAALGLPPINNIHNYILSNRPWLATDKTLGPAVSSKDYKVIQTGAWVLNDASPLPDHIEQFLQGGKPPIYVGFGSMTVGNLTGQDLVDACRSTGNRAIIYRGWANLDVVADDANILAVDAVNHSKLFPRVAAVVHHGGVGTTTAAAIAGVPQVLVPHYYDQFYWALRIKQLGAGIGCRNAYTLSADSLAGALREVLQPSWAENAAKLSKQIDLDGAKRAAELIHSTLS